jgi:hypothetical protein
LHFQSSKKSSYLAWIYQHFEDFEDHPDFEVEDHEEVDVEDVGGEHKTTTVFSLSLSNLGRVTLITGLS